MAYQVLTTDEGRIITDTAIGLRLQVNEQNATTIPENSAYCLATLYRIQGGFLPGKVFIFRALTATGLEDLKKAVDFFFLILLDTELYITEIPKDSLLFEQETQRWYGTANLIGDSRAE